MYPGRFAKTTTNIDECKVAICNATLCIHNEEKRCTLEEIVLDDNASCMQFTRKDKHLPEAKE